MPYEKPTAAEFKARYPAFADVDDATVTVHVDDAAATGVDTSWLESDYAPAVSALAAHNMASLGLGAQSKAETYARQGVTSIKSGSFSVGYDASRAAAAADGEYSATAYGQTYEKLLRKNKGGPRVLRGRAGPCGFGTPLLRTNHGRFEI